MSEKRDGGHRIEERAPISRMCFVGHKEMEFKSSFMHWQRVQHWAKTLSMEVVSCHANDILDKDRPMHDNGLATLH